MKTDFDPFEELMLHKHNIEQLVIAATHGSELMKELGNKFNHQQGIINQLVYQNQRLNELIKQNRLEVSRLTNEITQLKIKNSQ